MPELPEVETTRRGIQAHVVAKVVARAVIRQPRLRWRVPDTLPVHLEGRAIEHIHRRGKYLLFGFPNGTMIVHLGMSGSLRLEPTATPPGRHDQVDLVMEDGNCLRLRDPRRFGAVLWTDGDPLRHPLLATLGPEPLSGAFNGHWLHQKSRGRRLAVKPFIMDSHVVVGVGNIYANEALFLAGIHPARAGGRISLARYQRLSDCIQQVLNAAIEAGGTTLRDFVSGQGQPGYFAQHLRVYGRAGQPCEVCNRPLTQRTIGQRASYFCAYCQH